MATAFINKIIPYCGWSRALAWLLTINLAASVLLWITALALILCGTPTVVLYSLTSLPSDVTSFAFHPWTLMSYMFVHFSPWHLLFNILWLYWFGRLLADTGNAGRITLMYIGGGVSGGVMYLAASLLTGYAPGAFLTGASAAVLAVICSVGMLMPERRIRLFLLGSLKLKWLALICVAMTIIGSAGAGVPTQAAHAGGILFGISYCLMLRLGSSQSMRQSKAAPARKVHVRATVKAMSENTPDQERLDQLLDKMRVSGYDSLSSKEKTELNYISSRLGD